MMYPAKLKVLRYLEVISKSYPIHFRSWRTGSSWWGKYLVRYRKACLLLREVRQVQISYILSFQEERSVWLLDSSEGGKACWHQTGFYSVWL
jgi:hypothetical protein